MKFLCVPVWLLVDGQHDTDTCHAESRGRCAYYPSVKSVISVFARLHTTGFRLPNQNKFTSAVFSLGCVFGQVAAGDVGGWRGGGHYWRSVR